MSIINAVIISAPETAEVYWSEYRANWHVSHSYRHSLRDAYDVL